VLTIRVLLSDSDGTAYFECWSISTPFADYPTVGSAIVGFADVSNISYVILPPRSDEGLHKPPHPIFFVLLSGLAHVSLPKGDGELWIMEGVNGLMVAADVTGDGHYTMYPSNKETIALQIPFLNGTMPKHEVLRDGVCHGNTKHVKDSGGEFGSVKSQAAIHVM